jgi:hypothetical protein
MSAKSALRHDEAQGAYLDLNLVVNVFLGHLGGVGKDFVKRLESSLRCIESICSLETLSLEEVLEVAMGHVKIRGRV